MKIYTKVGDQGQTSLVDGKKVSKSELRIDTYGTVDELNSHIGLLISNLNSEILFKNEIFSIQELQKWLFELGSQLACADPKISVKLPTLKATHIITLENWIDAFASELPPLKNFILPGGHRASSQAHICRTVARRAERLCVQLSENEKLDYPAIPFLNRLSDYFFMLARVINHRLNIKSIEWLPE